MGKKRYAPEQIIPKLREVEVLMSQGMKTPLAARQAGIVEQTYYRRQNTSCIPHKRIPNGRFSIFFVTFFRYIPNVDKD